MMNALILVGRGRYADPWHDHAATSFEVAEVLRDLGVPVEVRSTFPEEIPDVDLVVVNAGPGRADPGYDGDDDAWRPFHESLARQVASGTSVLGLHLAANTFADAPVWTEILGGRWVDGTSGHPPIGEATFKVVRDHPVTQGLTTVTAFDESYCDLEVHPASQRLLVAEIDGVEQPVVWVAPTLTSTSGRVLYDALGHDVRSYRSPARRDLLARELTWLLRR